MTHESKNDQLIEEFIKDPLYKINKDGKVYTKLTLNGQGISEEWREMGYEKKDGYVRFRYKDEFLFAHRVVYRKHCGKLKKDMTVNHKNLDNSDNRPENLELISQGENNNKKHKTYKKSILAKVVKKLKETLMDKAEKILGDFDYSIRSWEPDWEYMEEEDPYKPYGLSIITEHDPSVGIYAVPLVDFKDTGEYSYTKHWKEEIKETEMDEVAINVFKKAVSLISKALKKDHKEYLKRISPSSVKFIKEIKSNEIFGHVIEIKKGIFYRYAGNTKNIEKATVFLPNELGVAKKVALSFPKSQILSLDSNYKVIGQVIE